MAKRRKIALIYEYNENWIGGTYYIQNLVHALNVLPDERKPAIVILSREKKHFNDLAETTRYPYLSYLPFEKKLNVLQRGINKISSMVVGKNLFSRFHTLHIVFPYIDREHFSKTRERLYWIPDFQEHYLPEFFSEYDVGVRKRYQASIVKEAKYIVFSSRSAKADFDKFYPGNTLKKYLLPFAVTHPLNNAISKNELLERFTIPGDYFLCSNQFWKHKNHGIILQAIAYLKSAGEKAFVVFTGKEFDDRHPDYSTEIKELAKSLQIEDRVRFLGFISRADQLALMKNSLAVIQPSLFEGWSTVIEDAKALSVPVIASEIDVHKEQLADYSSACLFPADSVKHLVECLMKSCNGNNNMHNRTPYLYQPKIKEFGERFMRIVEEIA